MNCLRGFLHENYTFVKLLGWSCLGVAFVYVVFKNVMKMMRTKRRAAYPKDTIILHQYPRGLRAPSPSPYSLKLETWLRMAGIPYKV